jgi:hypothetical protein
MARQRKVLPARRHNAVADSLLIRSAESLGRMIGTLQRQLDAARHLTGQADDVEERRNGHVTRTSRGNHASKARTKKKSSAVKARSKSERPSKRTAKSAAAKKAPPKRRSGVSRRASKSSRGA